MKHRQTGNGGFTLVELMVVLLVTGVLLGLLVPALNMVKDRMLYVKQKAQFHTIEVGLEGFRADMGDYPPSYVPYPAPAQQALRNSYGALRLAEALIGRDGFGFHPKSLFRTDGLAYMDNDATPDEVYHVGTDYPYETSDQNLKVRKGPYIELEKANAVQLSVYGTWYETLGLPNNYVFADMFRVVKSARTAKLIGMPILYYRANTANYLHDATDANIGTSEAAQNNIYMMLDNGMMYELPVSRHPLADSSGSGYEWWYKKTTNPAFPGGSPPPPYPRPYRHDSFILHSAGEDGLYGTEDDVFNFDENE